MTGERLAIPLAWSDACASVFVRGRREGFLAEWTDLDFMTGLEVFEGHQRRACQANVRSPAQRFNKRDNDNTSGYKIPKLLYVIDTVM